ncbi:hypothetical protein MMC17_006222 [Xylographa soralifera]|nr:hypothetical protein [Xylographa soralifera]
MAEGSPSTIQSAFPSSFAAASSTVAASSAATSTLSTSAVTPLTIPSSSVASSIIASSATSSTIASSAASASTTALANQVDNSMSPGGIVAAAVFGFAVLLSCCYLAYLAYRKFQNHRQFQKNFHDQENAPVADESSALRPMSYFQFGKVPHDDVIEIVVHQPDQPRSAKALLEMSTPSTAASSPRSTEELYFPRRSPSPASPTPQPLPPHTPHHPRQPSPLLSSRLASPLPPPPRPDPQPHSTRRRLHNLSPPLPVRLSPFPATTRASPKPSSPSPSSTHSLSPTSSTALLMGHPATHGRRVRDVSPGLDPEYRYPMTPAQIGDGRPLSLLGRKMERGDGAGEQGWGRVRGRAGRL